MGNEPGEKVCFEASELSLFTVQSGEWQGRVVAGRWDTLGLTVGTGKGV